MALADALADWTDIDGAQYQLGRVVGLFADQSFGDVKWVFWTDNPLGQALHDMLFNLTQAGVLDHRDDDGELQFRWLTPSPLDALER
ncbi:hypothetical protein O7635_21265 [Asanoa sp. WMMD1127]|uniref:hypothetical protein n=1 Tax=Asanoa sp. WMMD1127 TaxID=3016107 RepID=UPI0024172187|nr:hypothetical protein [Asanoa sp. WMMD1127]MDG4824389.1 hypothetical protein [Asanoa sp. WMMD1127]